MYEAFYQLDKRPFALTPDSAFLFLSATHRKALSYLIYGLGQREGFIVITGDIGTGKTLIIQTMFEYLESKAIRGVRLAAANVGPADVLPLVATALGLPQNLTTKAALLAEIERTLLHRYPNGVLLIVDEAQTFTPEALEELRLLSNLSTRGRALLQISLVAQSDLRETLDHPRMEQLRQRIIAWHHLEPLNQDEVKDYIQSRLKTAGAANGPVLAPEMFPLIHRWSGGIPRKINILMDRLLLFGYLEEKRAFDASDVLQVIEEMEQEFGRRSSFEPTKAEADATVDMAAAAASAPAPRGREEGRLGQEKPAAPVAGEPPEPELGEGTQALRGQAQETQEKETPPLFAESPLADPVPEQPAAGMSTPRPQEPAPSKKGWFGRWFGR